ncbi:MAG TPA: SDR family oxidoreductase [Candidatus Limnocylindria bacterium]|nr:SDR family oxidoreductase [Candidatus Limnocylindria bacterium]
MAARTFLVTGGAGFIGSNVAEALVRRGDRVRVLDNFCTGKRENLAAAGDVELIEGDLRDLAAVERAVRGVEGVFHQAALRSVPRSVDDPTSTNDVNVGGTLTLLMACRQAGVRRVVYASSSSAYGDDPTLPKVETLPANPISPYAVAKLAAEHYCRTFARLYGLETVSLRYFNVFGPRQDPESKYSAVIPRFLEQALRHEPLEVHGDGLQSRDFTYIDNVVQGNLLAMDAPGVSGEVFNLACGSQHTLLAIADAIGAFLGRTLERRHVAPRPGDVRHTKADISKIQQMMGYQPTVLFDEGMRRTCTYFVERFGSGR